MSFDKFKQIAPGVVGLALLLASGAALAAMPLNLTEGVTPTSKRVYDLHMTILYIVTAIGVGVFGVMCWSIFHHRKSRGAVAARFHHSTSAEIIWTLIPILILIAMAIPATKTLIFMEQTGDSEITVKVTGYQWKWKYDYIEDGIDDGRADNISFFSALDQASNETRQRDSGRDPNEVKHYLLDVDNQVVLPINTKVRILTTAADVIHSWWVPALGWKRDAIPGFINDNWTYIEKPGIYRGQCAELCGKDHGFMPIVVNAVTKEQYAAWVEQKKNEQDAALAGVGREWSKDELMTKGKAVYATNCASCHMPEGQGVAGLFPALQGSAVVNGEAEAMIQLVLNGKNLMPVFKDQLDDVDLAAVMSHVRNSWGNSAGLAQPEAVRAGREAPF